MHLRYVSKFPLVAAVMCAAASVSLGACGGTDPVDDDVVAAGEAQELTAESAEALTCPASLPILDMRKSLIVTKETDPNVMLEFTLSFVLQRLITSVGSDQEPLDLYQRWWDTQNDAANAVFEDPDAIHCDDVTDGNGAPLLNGFPYTCPRNEGVLAESNPFNPEGDDFMEPVALVNRFDLAPTDGSHCGEYRIIYAKKSGQTDNQNRNFIIFEGQLPNPQPECGVAACLPVAEFWASLSTMSETQRSTALEMFYFFGLPGFAPVIQASNFMASTGQIRTNQFMRLRPFGIQQWTLREFKLDLGTDSEDSSIRLFVQPVTVKDNPFRDLFTSTFTPSNTRDAFQSSFLDALDGLVPLGDEENDISLRTMPSPDLFNAGESIVDSRNDYRVHLQGNTAFIADIEAALVPLVQSRGLLPGTVTADNAADRATTQSCAGCHQLSNGNNLGGLHVWPAHFTPIDPPTAADPPTTFVHVDEQGNISDPLQFKFLPHRAQILTSFIEEHACAEACSSTAASADFSAASADFSAASADAPLGSAERAPTLGGSATH
ncbi:hypothetical protein [Sorangium sp. So ce887]|uniref:hypothetical protein n=1 Tax=Sorangium sp. So ce887 TaxID=3133324 RepID=UPI003F626D62